jgi:ABC-type Fe3+ transport system substrate-binding protein
MTSMEKTSVFMGLALIGLLAVVIKPVCAQSGSLDEIHKKALKEAGTLNFYGTLAQLNAEKIFPVFEKRFAGIRVNQVSATADQLTARLITEIRGGRVLADFVQMGLENIVRLHEQGLLLEQLPPEAAQYPGELKGSFWLASDLIFAVNAWTTSAIQKGSEPNLLDDLADPKWRKKLISEPRSAEVLIGLMHKHNNLEKAEEVLRRIAANDVEFHKGYPQLVELMAGGQSAVCIACRSHHFPPRVKKGAPLGYSLTEGIGQIMAAAVPKGGPNPNTALLFWRWAASQEGQKAFAQGGRTPAHPAVEPVEKTRPAKIYTVNVDDLRQWPKYEKIWKDIFKLR